MKTSACFAPLPASGAVASILADVPKLGNQENARKVERNV
jgi:hypothetical protein